MPAGTLSTDITVDDHPVVRVGQVWADNDTRFEGRKIEICRVFQRCEGAPVYVTAKVIAQAPGQDPRALGRISEIRADRLRPTSSGYRLAR